MGVFLIVHQAPVFLKIMEEKIAGNTMAFVKSVGSHTLKLHNADLKAMVPLDTAIPTLPEWMFGSHSFSPVDRLVNIGNAALNPQVQALISDLCAHPQRLETVAKEREKKQAIKSIPAEIPQLIFPFLDGSEISLSPVGCPKVITAVISELTRKDIEFGDLPPVANRLMAVGKPQNVSSGRIKGPIFHAVPPTVVMRSMLVRQATHDPDKWLSHLLKNSPHFIKLVECMEESLPGTTTPAWMRDRNTSILRSVISEVWEEIDDLLEHPEQHLEPLALALQGLIVREVGFLSAATLRWIKETFIEVAK